MINIDDLLKPITDDNPCGEDFTYHPSFLSLQTLSRGKPETQFSAAEEPQWKEVQDAAIEVLGKSKQLEAGVILAVSLLKIGSLEGFRDGLAVVRGLLERYWPGLYPKLDPNDENDPTERLNILNILSSAGEPYKVTVHLKQIALCVSPSMGRITLQQILAAKDRAGKSEGSGQGAGGSPGPDLNQIQAAFRDAGPEAAKSMLAHVNEAIGHAEGVEEFLDSTLGAGKGVSFDSLNKLLSEMKHAVEPHAADSISAEGAPGVEALGEGGRPLGRGVSGSIQTRTDVIKALGLICDYYRDNEPSSPVPLILQRAQRLVDKDFMTIMTDLTPDALTQLRVITGSKAEA